MTNNSRSIPFKHRSHGRYWWFQNRAHDYVPALFALLTDEEWDVIDQWYTETDARQSAGEANVPTLSFLMGMIEGNGISNIVQLGHFEGFSTLLLGFIMRRMGFRQSIFSVDISTDFSCTCEYWVAKAGLSEYVSIKVMSSDAPGLPAAARDYFKSDIASVFIDSSHQYQHTINELNLWFPALKPFGLIFLHDCSTVASDFDSTRNGGVIRAVKEWSDRSDASYILLNEDVVGGHNPTHLHQLVYQDGCGLGIIQKRPPWATDVPLPASFNPERYLALNPDVAAASADPAAHWKQYGYREGRRWE
jgi:predicted O-methyltransferase YrrM